VPEITDYTQRVAFHPTDFRPLWKKVKAKHQATLTAKKIKFAAELGPLLDQRAAQWNLIATTRLKQYKRVQLTPKEKQETDPAKRKATAKTIIANDKGNAALMKADLKQMVTICNAIIKTARGYKSRIQGLGDPAEHDLTDALDQIVTSAELQLESTHQAQSSLAARMANPNRYDHLK